MYMHLQIHICSKGLIKWKKHKTDHLSDFIKLFKNDFNNQIKIKSIYKYTDCVKMGRHRL